MFFKFKLFQIINNLLTPTGYYLHRRYGYPRTSGDALQILKKHGIAPAAIFDVGVHKSGTPELYTTFPGAQFVLIDPVEKFKSAINGFCRSLPKALYLSLAASHMTGRAQLEIRKTKYVHAGLVEAGTPAREAPVQTEIRNVDTITFDDVCRDKHLTGPYLIKVDVDGKDLDVIRGASLTLQETGCVIIESLLVNMRQTIQCLEERQSFLWGIVDLLSVKESLWQADLIFLHNRYRQDPRFQPWLAKNFSW